LLAATSEAGDPELESIIDQARLAGDHEVQVVILDALARRAAQRGQLRTAQQLLATADSALGCYGSPIETPSFDALAANGLRYNNMHTTALCSPRSRSWRFPATATPTGLQLYVDGTLTGNAEAPVTNPFILNPGALTCGANLGSAVTDDYASPFKFTGTIHSVTVDVSGELIHDTEAELRMLMARQ
jgi:hypothetical protein